MRNLLKYCCMLFLLTGCSAYWTKYHKPKVPVKNHWTVPDRNITHNDNKDLPLIAWWKKFDDPTLNNLIYKGMLYNNRLNMSRSNIQAARGELEKVKLQWIPDIDFLFGYSRNPAFGFPGTLALFLPSYIINIFSQIKEQSKAKYELADVKAEDDAVKLTLISQIAAGYFTYSAELERKVLFDTLENDLRKLAEISLKMYRDGIATDINPEQLDAQVDRIHGEKEVVLRNIVVSRDALRYLINRNPGEIKITRDFMSLKSEQIIPGSLPLSVLSNRPDMQMAENRLKASVEGIGFAASGLLPTLTLDLFFGPIATNSRYATPRHIIKFNDQLLKVPAIRMSVLGEIAKAKGLKNMSYYNYIDTLQKALRDTTNALSTNDHMTKKLFQTTREKDHLAKVYNLNYRLYQQGIQSYFKTLKTKIALDRARINLNQDKLQQLISIVTLYQELAAGYKTVPNPKWTKPSSGMVHSLTSWL